jgi:6-phosphogluconolactonase (cycloisomerase 2 family)
MTNSIENNSVVAFRRDDSGILSLVAFYRTQGRGTGISEVSTVTPNDGIDPLASQGSLVLSQSGQFLYAVNAGSNSISSFRVDYNGELSLIDVVPSGGLQPNSMDVYNHLLYVSNVGNLENDFKSNITGFMTNNEGHLNMIPDATRFLSTPNAQPARIIFSPDGRLLIVSELTTNHLSVFQVNRDGTVSEPMINNSSGLGPFGSYFLPSGLLLVAEAGTNALSSYRVRSNGALSPISGSIKNGQMATCWVVASRDGRFAYTSNTASGTISTYKISKNGILQLVSNMTSTEEGPFLGAPIDNGVSRDGRNFYALNGNQGSISVFKIAYDGQLIRVQVIETKRSTNYGMQGLAVI